MKSFFSKLWTNIWSRLKSVGNYARRHKIIAGVVVLVIIGLGWWAYTALAGNSASTEYVLSTVTKGPLQVTVTGSGQVNSQDDLSVTPQGSASGQITSIDVTPGEHVAQGQVIAHLDDTTAAEAVTSARQDLESAEISYQQTQTSSQSSITSDQTTAASDITNTYTNLPAVMNGLNTTLYGFSTITGEQAEQNVDAYAAYVDSAQAQTDQAQVIQDYQTAESLYQKAQSQYESEDVNTLNTTQLMQLAQLSEQATTAIDTALRDTLTYYNYINDQVQNGRMVQPSQLASQISSLTTYQNTVSGDTTALTNDYQNLQKDSQTLDNDTASQPLNVQSAELAVQKAQEALAQAETNDDYYTVVAPFSGTIATVPVNQYDQASGGTTIVTLITDQEYADLSLNESDVAKVQVGQPASMTFDALPNVTMTGTVQQIDPVGTVTQGVVTYDVRIGFAQNNPDIKPGMSVDATILTASEASAVQVPSSAITTNGNTSTVKVAVLKNASSTLASRASSTARTGARRTRTASSTSAYGGGAGSFGSSASAYSFSTTTLTMSSTTPILPTTASFSRSLTVPATDVTIETVPVTVGITNDTSTEILSGLTPGEYVVTATQSATQTKSAAASATSLLGGTRTTGAAAGGAGFGGGATFRASATGGAAGGAGRGG